MSSLAPTGAIVRGRHRAPDRRDVRRVAARVTGMAILTSTVVAYVLFDGVGRAADTNRPMPPPSVAVPAATVKACTTEVAVRLQAGLRAVAAGRPDSGAGLSSAQRGDSARVQAGFDAVVADASRDLLADDQRNVAAVIAAVTPRVVRTCAQP